MLLLNTNKYKGLLEHYSKPIVVNKREEHHKHLNKHGGEFMQFKRILGNNNTVGYLSFPKEIIEWLNVELNSEIIMEDKEDKNGRYIKLYKGGE